MSTTTGKPTTTGNMFQDPNVGNTTGAESSLSNWAGPYVTDMLGKGQALAGLPYAGYQGPLTAGASPLQQNAFSGIAGLTVPTGVGDATNTAGDVATAAGNVSYSPNNISTELFPDNAQQYMNPFVQQALNPELDELRRQAQIQRVQDAGRMTKAGAYGGGRQAIMESELNDNMLRLMAERTGKGYRDAYDRAAQVFGQDMDRVLRADTASEQSRQFGAGLGLDALRTQLDAARTQGDLGTNELRSELDLYNAMADMGRTQRGIEGEGIAADQAQFEEERDYPYKMVQFMQSLLSGMPLGAQNYSYAQPSWLSEFGAGVGGTRDLIKILFGGGSGGGGGDGSGGGGGDAIDIVDNFYDYLGDIGLFG